MDCIVVAIVWTIAGVNAHTWYTATHNYAKSSCLKIAGVKGSLLYEPVRELNSQRLHEQEPVAHDLVTTEPVVSRSLLLAVLVSNSFLCVRA